MKLKIYQADAFTDKVFGGNPAAVIPLEDWLSDDLLQKIAMENNLAETAFYVKEGKSFRLRWFTPIVEVELCGHATLATAYIMYEYENYKGDEIIFKTKSGDLKVTKSEDMYTMSFPVDEIYKDHEWKQIVDAMGASPLEIYKGKMNYMLVYKSEKQIKSLTPDFRMLKKIKAVGIIATAKGDKADFVSRFFAPRSGIDEDSVTGSAHTSLTQYWTKKLTKTNLIAIQLSNRKGHLFCRLRGNRVEISGKAKLYLKGEIEF